jgi:eukaryotic-like serine/threonine-protein kinase
MPDPSDPIPLTQRERSGTPAPTAISQAEGAGGTIAQITPSLAALASAPSPLQVTGYEILNELGRGGMGAVFKGRDLKLGRDLAIKVLLETCQSDEPTLHRFMEEAQIGGQLQHPGVVPVYEVGRLTDQRPYFTMKLVEGRTLTALLKDRKSPADDLPRFLKIFEQLCQTLAYVHARGVIHRDLKPLNIMVGAFGEVQVMDWGLAKVVKSGGVHTIRSEGSDSETTTGSVLGTPAYMAPEQACGDVEGLDERCDVFGLGAMLCEILTGGPPYLSQERGELLRQAARANLTNAFERLDACGADAELIGLAKACLAPEPAERLRDGRTVAEAMGGYLSGVQERLRTAEVGRAAAQARAKEERKRRRLTVALAATVLLAAVGVGAGALWYQQDRAARAAERARRVAETERDVTAALDEAATLGGQARKLTGDPVKWEAALSEGLSAVKRAEGVLNGGVGAPELRGRVEAAREELEAADKNRRMIARLEEARMQQAEAGTDGFDNAGAAALYATAFEQDMGLAALTPEEAADRINHRDIRKELLAALADWANLTPNKDEEQRLRVLLQATDSDPASFQNRMNAFAAQKDGDGLRKLAFRPETLDQPPARLADLGRLLKPADGVRFLRAANDRHPDDFWIAFQLAYALQNFKHPLAADEAIRFYTAALALRPRAVVVHNNLGIVFHGKGRLDEAIHEFRKALELKSDYTLAHYNLGIVLYEKGLLDDAIAEYRNAIDLDPNYALAHNNLGNALREKGRTDEAVAQYQRAVALKPDYALAFSSLGYALRMQGRFSESLAAYRRAHELGSKDPAWHNPSAEWVRVAEDWVRLDALLPIVLRNEAAPLSPAVGLEFAKVCFYKRRYADSMQFFSKSFAADPTLAENLTNGNRYNAACAAALASTGQGDEGKSLDDKDRSRLRKQAADWLRADLRQWTKKIGVDPRSREIARQTLQNWQEDADLTGVRDKDALNKLPPGERDAWRKLWADVEVLQRKAESALPPK